MVTILPKESDWSDAFQAIGQGVSQGYQNRADQQALQNSIMGLENASPQDVLKAILGTNTYNPQSKQNFFQNALGIENFKELQRKTKAKEEVDTLKAGLDEAKKKKELEAAKNDALTLIDASALEHAEKESLREKVNKGEASYDAIKEVLKPNKQLTKEKEEEKAQETTQRAFDNIAALIPDVGRSGILTSKLGGDTAKAYSQFTSLTGALEALLVEKVNRGALSNTRFKYITETLLPKPSDSQADIRGKLEGLATILELDPSALTGKKAGTVQQSENKRPPLTSFERK